MLSDLRLRFRIKKDCTLSAIKMKSFEMNNMKYSE